MGVYGCMKFAFSKGLVKSQSIVLPLGTKIPVAVDLWNVMYGLMERSYRRRASGEDDAALTLRCLYSLLRMLHRRAYYPIFVSDRGIYGDGKALHGAKAIGANAVALGGGSGRLDARMFDEDMEIENALVAEGSGGGLNVSRKRCSVNRNKWSSKPETPRVSHRLCLSVIRLLGFPYVNATNMEADDLCANLFHTKTVPYVLSSDTDLLLMGCDIIVDVSHLFPLIIRCKDVLAELNMDYATFLSKFVRCHTDLHKEPYLKSMQEVIELHKALQRADRCGSDGELDPKDDYEGFSTVVRPKRRKKLRKSSTRSWRDARDCDIVRHGTAKPFRSFSRKDRGLRAQDARPVEDKAANCRRGSSLRQRIDGFSRLSEPSDDPDENYRDGSESEATRGARVALESLRPAQTRCEVLEHKFIKHVAGILTPERRTSRVNILKRIPIIQDPRDPDAVRELIRRSLGDKCVAESIATAFINRVPAVQNYKRVLIKYWD
ncbi:tegument host shutoff protein [Columbid alphaherpesvirus 1]|uniref:Virion host shutoff protein n=1 Tax=Columbid alphaherpesvirus 1 TaxID=93386 RepID=A0A1V0M8H8_9ALPH|nr:tegument host shutoff protein [Columbid alphaherpesvirus 1]ARD71366.1 tegument host shutoff protein [Columbid alphaherpesvirus 1]